MQTYLLAYLFACFSVGIACLSLVLLAARRQGDRVSRGFLLFYASLTFLVLATLVRAFSEVLPEPVSPAAGLALEYLESIFGRYGVLVSLPLFVHRLLAIESPRRDYRIAAVVGVAVAVQHVTEFGLGGTVWDDRGDLFEDALSAGILAHVLWLGLVHRDGRGVHRPLADPFLVLLVLGLPGLLYDVFRSDDGWFRFYPLWYCAGSIVVTRALMRRSIASPATSIPSEWGLSDRETDVARLVQRGRSNKEIAELLGVSPNTVKTHLRSVFDKAGVHSRFELIAAAHATHVAECRAEGPISE